MARAIEAPYPCLTKEMLHLLNNLKNCKNYIKMAMTGNWRYSINLCAYWHIYFGFWAWFFNLSFCSFGVWWLITFCWHKWSLTTFTRNRFSTKFFGYLTELRDSIWGVIIYGIDGWAIPLLLFIMLEKQFSYYYTKFNF